MHLTLTVPHTTSGFAGKEYYYREFTERFKRLRRQKFFKENIYGGEFGIETTRTENGLNIHSHSLLMVKRFRQNRNYLHREILRAWNKLTICERKERQDLTSYRIENIRKSNRSLTEEWIKNNIDARGATLIGLENIYVKNASGEKQRQLDEEARIKAVMETVSYHFAPKMFEKEANQFDFELIAKVLLHTKGVRLYDRFGVFRQSKVLKMKEKTQLDEFQEAHEVKRQAIEESLRGRFYAINPRRVYHNFDKEEIIIHSKTLNESKELNAINTVQAIEGLTHYEL